MTHSFSHENPFAPSLPPTPQAGYTLEERLLSIEENLAVIEKMAASPGTDNLTFDIASGVKDIQGKVQDIFTACKNNLWAKHGAGKHTTPDGRSFSFTRPATSRRSTDYSVLEKFPEAYNAAVKVTKTKPGTVGNLRLGK